MFQEKLHIILLLFYFVIMLTREEILSIWVVPKAIIYKIQILENIVEEQAVRIVELAEHGNGLESRLNQNLTTAHRKLCKFVSFITRNRILSFY